MSLALLIPGLTITAAMGTASALTSLANGAYTLSDRIYQSTDSGVSKIKALIQSSDLKTQIEIMKDTVDALKVDNCTPMAIAKAVTSIKSAVDAVIQELEQIDYRIKYNDQVTISFMGARYYKFGNSYIRLEAKIKTLNTRYDRLLTLISMRGMLNDAIPQNNHHDNCVNGENDIDDIDKIEKDIQTIMICDGNEFADKSFESVEKSKTD